ncbi:sodium- and chloride-dependent betaine transporter-like [Takifugu flavidus]|uniref:sodium- and chloride-dependent betaine transporter-like n=1 Tax=Takifugu flavidus TaxID=433684 RepID=UPI00254436BC|nr:sodium- and chloride-dependent betaine transporter-like [Takifugu flavidus]
MERREKEDQSSVGARGQWASKTEYILVVAGNVVGLGNVWRFPYLCYRYGGGAFLIPYCLLAVVFGIPLFLLETSLGQFTQEGFITCWRKVCTLAQGVGYGYLVLKVYEFVYIIIQAWALFYLVFSFRSELPWATCNNTWNTGETINLNLWDLVNLTTNETAAPNATSAATEFWERRMLRMSGGIEEVGGVSWELTLCLLVSWVFCYFSIWKGVRSTGKVAYFTATFPYVMLLILLVRGLTLPGAFVGVYFYLYPSLQDLANLEVWIEAGSQICFSYSLAIGNLIVLGSYNKHNNNCYKDCLWICLLNSCTSFVAGFVVFSVLGFMAEKQGVTIDAVADSGPGLAFIAYPQATALMPLPQFWTACFFLMLVLLAVDTQFTAVESFITTVSDLFPKVLRAPIRHELFVLVVCLANFLFDILFVTEGGIYIFYLIDYYGGTRVCQNFLTIGATVAVGWIFGADRLLDIIGNNTGQRPPVFFKICWKYVTPVLSLISYVLYLSDYRDLKINDWYVYPNWAYVLGWMMTFSSAIPVPLWVIIHLCSTTGSFRERLAVGCRAVEDPGWKKIPEELDGANVELMASAVKA